MTRKVIVLTIVGAILFVADLPEITASLTNLGLVGVAKGVQAEFLTGTALTGVAVLLILLPRAGPGGLRAEPGNHVCSICEQRIATNARYCQRCGCRAL